MVTQGTMLVFWSFSVCQMNEISVLGEKNEKSQIYFIT